MKITEIAIRSFDTHQEITASIDRLSLWFRLPADTRLDGEDATPFVQMALVPAMMLGEEIEVDQRYGVSPRFLAAIDHLNDLYHTWNPALKPTRVNCRARPPAPKPAGTGCLFSGGVDGTYTFLKHRGQVDQLIFVNGFEANYADARWQEMFAANRRFADQMGVRLVPVETNHRSFLAAFNLSGFANFAFRLAAIGQLLGHSRLLLSGAETYAKLHPSGCHPLLDPWLSTEATEVQHIGLEADRAAKIGLIKQTPEALANLSFCQHGGATNCGQCSKCIRTWVALVLNGIEDFPFVHPVHLDQLRKVRIVTEEQAQFFENFRQRAQAQQQQALAGILQRRLVRYELRKLLLLLEEVYLPDAKKKRIDRLPDSDLRVQVNILPRYSDHTSIDHARQSLLDPPFQQEVHDIGTVFGHQQ